MADCNYSAHEGCAHCGEQVHQHARGFGRERLYCSNNCRIDHWRAYDFNDSLGGPGRKCKTCNGSIAIGPGVRGRPPIYCSDECKPKPGDRPLIETQCAECGSAFWAKTRSKKYCSDGCRDKRNRRKKNQRDRDRGRRAVGEADCQCCGKRFTVYHGTKGMFCSKSCSSSSRPLEARDNARATQWNAKLEAATGKFSPVMDAKCIHCDTVYTRSRGCGVYCSGDCRDADRELHRGWNRRMARGQPLTQLKVCPETGWIFKPEHHGQVYASREIAKQAARHRAKVSRRARKVGNGRVEGISRSEVFRSVGYVCQICGDQTDPDLRGTHEDLAPELDHIIPLSRGGTHTWGNVQCACRKCNSKKGGKLPDWVDKRQLMLSL